MLTNLYNWGNFLGPLTPILSELGYEPYHVGKVLESSFQPNKRFEKMSFFKKFMPVFLQGVKVGSSAFVIQVVINHAQGAHLLGGARV